MKTTWLERGLLVTAVLVLVYPGLVEDLIGLSLFVFAATLQYLHWRARTSRVSATH